MKTAIDEVHRRPTHQTVTETSRRLTNADVAAIAEAFRQAVKEAIHPQAPPPRKPGDSDDQHSGDAWAGRANLLLGNHARTGVRSYSLSDLVPHDGATNDDTARDQARNRDRLFSGKPLDG